MGERLGIAAALLADPVVLILDEPVNGLDLDGIEWIRALLGQLAQEGTHGAAVLAPDERDAAGRRAPADHRPGSHPRRHLDGRLHRALLGWRRRRGVSGRPLLANLLAAHGATLTSTEAGRFEVRGLTADAIGDLAAGHRLRLHELAPIAASLESAYHQLTRNSVEYAAA